MSDEQETQAPQAPKPPNGKVLSTNPALAKIELAEAKANSESAQAKARKEAADADKAQVDAKLAGLPTVELKPREGKVELGDNVGLIADLVAHAMLDKAATRFAQQLEVVLADERAKVLLVDSPDLIGSDWPHKAIDSQLRRELQALTELKGRLSVGEAGGGGQLDGLMLERETGVVTSARLFTAAGLPGALAIGKGISAAVGAAADVASLLRGDYEFAARPVSIGSAPLFAAISRRLIPHAKVVNLDGFSTLGKSKLFAMFEQVMLLRSEVQLLAVAAKEEELAPADRVIERAKAARETWNAALGNKEISAETLAELRRATLELEEQVDSGDLTSQPGTRALVAAAEAAVTRIDSFAEAVTKAPKSGYPPLIAAAIRERLHAKRNGYTHVLYAAIESSGGETIVRKGFLKSRVRFVGGAQVSYLLWDVRRKRMVAADTASVLGEVKMKLGMAREGAKPLEDIKVEFNPARNRRRWPVAPTARP